MLEFCLMLPGLILLTILVVAVIGGLVRDGVDRCRKMTRDEFKSFLLGWLLVYIPIIMFVIGLFMLAAKIDNAMMEKNNIFVEQQ